MRAMYQLLLMLLFVVFAGNVAAAERETVSTWPSAVTTEIIDANGNVSFLCNSTDGKVCNFVLFDEECLTSPQSNKRQAKRCQTNILGNFQLALGKGKEMPAIPGNARYCASAKQPVAIPACLRNVQNIAVPYTEKTKVSWFFSH